MAGRMPRRVKAPAPASTPPRPPAVHASSGGDEWLRRNIQDAVSQGVALGTTGNVRNANPLLHGIVHDREFLWNLQKQLESLGIQGFDEFGVNDLPRAGAFKTTFSAGDNVVKLADLGSTWQDARVPQGVWGVAAPTHQMEIPAVMDDTVPSHRRHDGLDVVIQPRAILNHPTWGPSDPQHTDTLLKAIERQGWRWHDDHIGNLGFLPGDEYRPVAIDGDVVPYGGMKTVDFPFKPPTRPDWYYSVLLPLLMSGGGAQEPQQQPTPLSGLTGG
jgi:hypothetical protein